MIYKQLLAFSVWNYSGNVSLHYNLAVVAAVDDECGRFNNHSSFDKNCCFHLDGISTESFLFDLTFINEVTVADTNHEIR
jgi:hypothetical protein